MIYLDYAAATPVSKKALESMMPFFSDDFFNPSSPYFPAKKVQKLYEEAKDEIAHTIGAKGIDLIMTSGATEATNLAFTCLSDSGKVLVLETEHQSVLETAKNYNHDLIKVDQNGKIDIEDLKKKIADDVELVSVSIANNELGTIQPIAEISEIIKKNREKRLKEGLKTPLYLHSDASQALNLLEINVPRLGIDLLTLNAAKVYGPKGIGALYASHEVKLKPISYGGGQEKGLRSGTENVPSVIGFATAIKEAKLHQYSNRKKYEDLKKAFIEEIKKSKLEVIFLGKEKNQLANFIPISLPNLDAERLIYKLEDREIYVSTGAACAASKGKKSHVLKAIGLTDEEIDGSLRITLGNQSTKENIVKAAKEILNVAKEEYDRTKK